MEEMKVVESVESGWDEVEVVVAPLHGGAGWQGGVRCHEEQSGCQLLQLVIPRVAEEPVGLGVGLEPLVVVEGE